MAVLFLSRCWTPLSLGGGSSDAARGLHGEFRVFYNVVK